MSLAADESSYSEMMRSVIRAIAYFTHQAMQQGLEPVRLARAGFALLAGGCSRSAPFPGHALASYLTANQQHDGGWADVAETLWCLGFLAAYNDKYENELANGINWLTSVRLPCGAWGKNDRDQPRIPVTALTAALVPEVVDGSALKWLANQWEADLASPTQLTYKGAFYLLTQTHSKVSRDDELVIRTISYLAGEQAEDGGFGPWKGHPMGSDPWSTGVVLWGLSRVGKLAPRQIIERALSWLKSKQLSNGLWPYHYLDDGAAMALIGISSVLPFLSE